MHCLLTIALIPKYEGKNPIDCLKSAQPLFCPMVIDSGISDKTWAIALFKSLIPFIRIYEINKGFLEAPPEIVIAVMEAFYPFTKHTQPWLPNKDKS